MSEGSQRGPILRGIVCVWNGMNFVRRLILNLLFFTLLLIVLAIVIGSRSGSLTPLEDRTTLVIAPEAELVEQYRSDPVTRALLAELKARG